VNKQNFFQIAFAMALLCSASQILAQKMYRCGNVYQDLPCAGAEPSRVVGNTGSAATSSPVAINDAQCTQRGADALQIVYKRDSGALREQQISELQSKSISSARKQEEMDLIESVYRKRGSAPEIRAAIQAECIAEKERYAQAAALAAAAMRLQGGAPVIVQPQASVAPGQADTAGMETRQAADTTARNESVKQARCSSLARQAESLRKQGQSGGNIAAMERLNDQRRAVDEKLRSEAC
jgi:hypothetical protein